MCVFRKAQDIYPATYSGYLSGRRLGARMYRLRLCMSLRQVLVVPPQRHENSQAADDLNPSK